MKLFYLFILLLFLSTTCFAKTIVPKIKIVDKNKLEINGNLNIYGKNIYIPKQTVTVEKATMVTVHNEKYENFGIYDPKAPHWAQGVLFKGTNNGETGARGSLDAKSVVVKGDPEGKVIYKLNKDYGMGAEWGCFGRLANERVVEDRSKGTAMVDVNLLDMKAGENLDTNLSSIKEGDTVYVDYTYCKWRLDTIATDKKGKLTYVKGTPGVQIIEPPVLDEGLFAVCNVFVRNDFDQVTEEMLYPISKVPNKKSENKEPLIKTQLPRTYDKIVNKKEITILYWGDSVTCGGTVTDFAKYVWQEVVSRSLREKYPDTTFHFETTAWGGRGVGNFFETPKGQNYNFDEHVLGKKPDLVIMEFVNDSYQSIKPEWLKGNYDKVQRIFAENNIDWVIMLPHFTDFDRNDFGTEKYTVDQRWYDKWVREEYVKKYPNIAVADASTLWGNLLYEGIPFCTLNVNGINHPCNKGHQILADAVLNLF